MLYYDYLIFYLFKEKCYLLGFFHIQVSSIMLKVVNWSSRHVISMSGTSLFSWMWMRVSFEITGVNTKLKDSACSLQRILSLPCVSV